MDQVHVIRHKVRVEGRSVRQVAREMGVSRNTVRRYLDQETPIGVRRPMPRPAPVREVVEPRLEALLASTARATGGKGRAGIRPGCWTRSRYEKMAYEAVAMKWL